MKNKYCFILGVVQVLNNRSRGERSAPRMLTFTHKGDGGGVHSKYCLDHDRAWGGSDSDFLTTDCQFVNIVT